MERVTDMVRDTNRMRRERDHPLVQWQSKLGARSQAENLLDQPTRKVPEET